MRGEGYSWYETHVGPIKENGEITAVTLLSTDLSEWKQAERSLRKSEELYRSLCENIPGLVFRGSADWSVETITRTTLHCDKSYFYLDAELDAYEGDKRVYSQNWNRRVKRNLV